MARMSTAGRVCLVVTADGRLLAPPRAALRGDSQPAQQEAQPPRREKTRQNPDDAEPKPKPKSKQKAKGSRTGKATARRDRPGFYMGRPIADVMSWEGVDWLFRETRIEEEQPEAMLDALKIPKGATVADVGAGAGYHSIRLAQRVGPKGPFSPATCSPRCS